MTIKSNEDLDFKDRLKKNPIITKNPQRRTHVYHGLNQWKNP
jgi:hypothetical protein